MIIENTYFYWRGNPHSLLREWRKRAVFFICNGCF